MQTAQMMLGLGSALALSLGLGLLLARLLWSGLLRAMCACMHLGRPAAAPSGGGKVVSIGRSRLWDQTLGRASARS
ncbi:MAG TPA: hypothetical protein VE825_11575 [Terriglobales bacterium]|jgi:hypothetical protein|nr:hypothetical protein [Terriglobales bacterium]